MLTSDAQIQRYSRQLILKSWGSRQQTLLGATSVAVSTDLPSAALYLAAAGVGRLVLVGEPAPRLSSHLRALNPHIVVTEEQCDSNAADWAIVSQTFSASRQNRPAPRTILVNTEKNCPFALSLGCSAVSELLSEFK